jgi:hypothetical protein
MKRAEQGPAGLPLPIITPCLYVTKFSTLNFLEKDSVMLVTRSYVPFFWDKFITVYILKLQ